MDDEDEDEEEEEVEEEVEEEEEEGGVGVELVDDSRAAEEVGSCAGLLLLLLLLLLNTSLLRLALLDASASAAVAVAVAARTGLQSLSIRETFFFFSFFMSLSRFGRVASRSLKAPSLASCNSASERGTIVSTAVARTSNCS